MRAAPPCNLTQNTVRQTVEPPSSFQNFYPATIDRHIFVHPFYKDTKWLINCTRCDALSNAYLLCMCIKIRATYKKLIFNGSATLEKTLHSVVVTRPTMDQEHDHPAQGSEGLKCTEKVAHRALRESPKLCGLITS